MVWIPQILCNFLSGGAKYNMKCSVYYYTSYISKLAGCHRSRSAALWSSLWLASFCTDSSRDGCSPLFLLFLHHNENVKIHIKNTIQTKDLPCDLNFLDMFSFISIFIHLTNFALDCKFSSVSLFSTTLTSWRCIRFSRMFGFWSSVSAKRDTKPKKIKNVNGTIKLQYKWEEKTIVLLNLMVRLGGRIWGGHRSRTTLGLVFFTMGSIFRREKFFNVGSIFTREKFFNVGSIFTWDNCLSSWSSSSTGKSSGFSKKSDSSHS